MATNFEKKYGNIFKETIDYFTQNGYTLIKFFLKNPNAPSLFKSQSTDPYFVKSYWCKSPDTCEAYKKGNCVLKNGVFGSKCPYGKIRQINGPSKRAGSGITFLTKAKELFVFDSVARKKQGEDLSPVESTCLIGDGKKIYLALSFLNNYVNPINKTLNIEDEHFIDVENFNEKTIRILLNYHPLALFGGEISSYQSKEVPKFIRDLSVNFKELYNKYIVGTEFDKLGKDIDYRGKKAFLQTLLPGKVELDNKIWDWDGESLTIEGKKLMSWSLTDEQVIIKPHDRTMVVVYDNKTVDQLNTVFKDI